jgi:hypothetical protein
VGHPFEKSVANHIDHFETSEDKNLMARDDFKLDIKETLARRVGMRCSNPNCRQPTSGPQQDPTKSVNVGVAAHITAAAKGGSRYDSLLSKEDRRSIENAIWLCQVCAKLIDNDSLLYTRELLRDWKRLSEEAARLAIEARTSLDPQTKINDVELIRFFAQCFDRPAFQDAFHQEGSMEAFDKAMEDTLTAINTGCLRAQDGAILSRSWGKSFLSNSKWHRQMDVISNLVRAIRSRYEDAKKKGVIHVNAHPDGSEFYCINDREIADWMDSTRSQILKIFSELSTEAGVHAPMFPRRPW